MSALYMSMSANEGELEIEDDLAKGKSCTVTSDSYFEVNVLIEICLVQPRRSSANSSLRSHPSQRRTSFLRKTSDILTLE